MQADAKDSSSIFTTKGEAQTCLKEAGFVPVQQERGSFRMIGIDYWRNARGVIAGLRQQKEPNGWLVWLRRPYFG